MVKIATADLAQLMGRVHPIRVNQIFEESAQIFLVVDKYLEQILDHDPLVLPNGEIVIFSLFCAI